MICEFEKEWVPCHCATIKSSVNFQTIVCPTGVIRSVLENCCLSLQQEWLSSASMASFGSSGIPPSFGYHFLLIKNVFFFVFGERDRNAGNLVTHVDNLLLEERGSTLTRTCPAAPRAKTVEPKHRSHRRTPLPRYMPTWHSNGKAKQPRPSPGG